MERFGLVCFAATLVLGCGSDATHICTLEARSSVLVSVADENGVKVTDADVKFSLDGGPAQTCDLFGDAYDCG